MVEIVKLDKKTQQKVLKRAEEAIKHGKVLVCPTDTVYGLICNGTYKKAVNRLFKIKKRSKGKPIPVFVKDIKMAEKIAKINPEQKKFLKKIWPGAVTVVLKRKGKNTIGIRIPRHKFVLNLLKEVNRPLAETSANISGKTTPTKIKEVLKQFKNQKYQPDLAIDAGNLKKSRSSTVIDLTGKRIKVLRNGFLSFSTNK